MEKIIYSLGKFDRGEYIYPCDDIYWPFRVNRDLVYAVLDTLEKENILKNMFFEMLEVWYRKDNKYMSNEK